MKNVLFAALALFAGVQVTAAHAAGAQQSDTDNLQHTSQAMPTVQPDKSGRPLLDQAEQKPGVNWDFASGHDASGVPQLRS